MRKYSNLTDSQKKLVCNGCGGKGGWIKLPDFIFKASCNHHDYKYWVGNTEEDFIKANKDFFKWMKVDITSERNWIKRQYYKIWAYSYYKAVSILGKKYFYFGKKKRDIDNI